MMTLEQAISRLEDMVSGCRETFPKSALRNNPRESADLLKFSFMTLLKMTKEAVREAALTNIWDIVFDDTPIPASWQKKGMVTYTDFCKKKEKEKSFLQYPDVLEECIDCCDTIIKRLDEVVPEKDDTMSVQDLNRKYYHKFFYFRNDDIGSQYVYVKNIHKNQEGHFEVDGTVVFTNGVTNTLGLYDVENFPIEDFYNFGDKNNRYTRCEDLVQALQSPVRENRNKTHVITAREAVDDVMFTFTWFYEIHIPEIAKIFKTVKFD